MFSVRYEEPKTLQEAEARKVQLVTDIASIQAQLSDRDRLVDGHRLTDQAWYAWRKRAIDANIFKLDELRRLKAWIRNYHRDFKKPHGDSDEFDLESLRRNASKHFHRLLDAIDANNDELKELREENRLLRERLEFLGGDPKDTY
jgi:hypothetical protein